MVKDKAYLERVEQSLKEEVEAVEAMDLASAVDGEEVQALSCRAWLMVRRTAALHSFGALGL